MCAIKTLSSVSDLKVVLEEKFNNNSETKKSGFFTEGRNVLFKLNYLLIFRLKDTETFQHLFSKDTS